MQHTASQEIFKSDGLQNALTRGDASARRLPAKAMMEHQGLEDFKGDIRPTLIEHRNRSKQPCVNIPAEL